MPGVAGMWFLLKKRAVAGYGKICFFVLQTFAFNKKHAIVSCRTGRVHTMKQKITVKDIAKQLGVNQATVSRALSAKHSSLISEKVRLKIRQYCDKVGYRPSFSGRSIVTGKTFKIGVILHSLENDFLATDWNRILCGLVMELQRYGYSLLLLYADGSETMDQQVSNFLMSGVADGYLTGPSMLGNTVLTTLEKLKIPLWVVTESGASISGISHIQRDDTHSFCEIWSNIPGEMLSCVAYYGAESETEPLRLQEIRRTGHLVYPDAGKLLTKLTFKRENPSSLVGYHDAFHNALRKMKTLCKYRFFWCDSDLTAMGLCDALSSRGIQVGKDVFIVGYGDLETYSQVSSSPYLSTVSAHAFEIGTTLGKAFISELSGNKAEKFIMKSDFIPRQTFPAPASSGREPSAAAQRKRKQ